MSIIDPFLDLTSSLPRDAVRLLKLLKEVDKKSVEINKQLSLERNAYLTKLRNKSQDNNQQRELHSKIINIFHNATSLSSYKQEIINELQYLLFDYTLNELNIILEKSEKEIKVHQDARIPSFAALPNDNKSYDDSISNATTSRKKIDIFSMKSNKNDTNKIIGRKKNRSQKTKHKKNIHSNDIGDEQDFSQQMTINVQSNTNEIDDDNHNQQEQFYCKCRGPSYGEMIACDNNKCPILWFHYDCVGIKEKPLENTQWYCCEECEKKAAIEERNCNKRKKKKGA